MSDDVRAEVERLAEEPCRMPTVQRPPCEPDAMGRCAPCMARYLLSIGKKRERVHVGCGGMWGPPDGDLEKCDLCGRTRRAGAAS